MVIAVISTIIILIGVIPEIKRIINKEYGETGPNITSWFLWTCLSVSTLLNYWAAGANPKGNSMPTYASCLNPCLVLIFSVIFYGKNMQKPKKTEIICFILVAVCLILFYVFKENKQAEQYIVYLGLIADAIASWPLFSDLRQNPMKYRPFFWIMFSTGYIIAIFSIEKLIFVNFSVPIYMASLGVIMAIPTIGIRIKNKTSLMKWI